MNVFLLTLIRSVAASKPPSHCLLSLNDLNGPSGFSFVAFSPPSAQPGLASGVFQAGVFNPCTFFVYPSKLYTRRLMSHFLGCYSLL